MAFIEKKDPVVLNIMITSKGRELLSRGELSFDYFGVGDSEIDYNFLNNTSFNAFNSTILRPVDKNPKILSFITRDLSGDTLNDIGVVPNLELNVENHIEPIGFFNPAATDFLTDGGHVKQPDIMIKHNSVTGGTILNINQAPSYLGNVNEPSKGDLLMIKWSNPLLIDYDTTGYTVNKNIPTPYLFYKIVDVISGSLAGDDLIVNVDREIPNFSLIVGGTDNNSGGIVFFNQINYSGDTECGGTSTSTTDDALIAFLQNCQCPTIRFPFWNLSIIYTENIDGVQALEKQYGEYNTNTLGGFVSYIQNQKAVYKKLGVIHYTNNSVANTYAEEFFGDPNNINDNNKIPTLDIPYIMWHKTTGGTMGLQLKPSGSLKYLTGETKSLNTIYYDLTDIDGNVVGKVFYDLKIFVIEDEDLLFALSYKSNRSWTLPKFKTALNANISSCPACTLIVDTGYTNPTVINGSDGTIIINGISGNIGFLDQGDIIAKLYDENDNLNSFTIISQVPFTFTGLNSGAYKLLVYDLKSSSCEKEYTFNLTEPNSTFSIINTGVTPSRLIANYTISESGGVYSVSGSDVVNNSGFYGTGFITVVNVNDAPPTYTITGNTIDSQWVKITTGDTVSSNSLSTGNDYIFYVRDVLPNSNITDAASGQTLTYLNL
jgi:hypothetical protein